MKSAKADEIFGFASDEIKSTHPPSRRISPNEVGFHRRRRFHPPARVDLVEKPTCRNKSIFGGGEGSRTPVRKFIPTAFSECSYLRKFPEIAFKQQTVKSGSLKAVTRYKALTRSRSPLIDALTEPRDSPLGRQPN